MESSEKLKSDECGGGGVAYDDDESVHLQAAPATNTSTSQQPSTNQPRQNQLVPGVEEGGGAACAGGGSKRGVSPSASIVSDDYDGSSPSLHPRDCVSPVSDGDDTGVSPNSGGVSSDSRGVSPCWSGSVSSSLCGGGESPEPSCPYRLPMFAYSENFSPRTAPSRLANYNLLSGFVDKPSDPFDIETDKINLDSIKDDSEADIFDQIDKLDVDKMNLGAKEVDLVNKMIIDTFIDKLEISFRDQLREQERRERDFGNRLGFNSSLLVGDQEKSKLMTEHEGGSSRLNRVQKESSQEPRDQRESSRLLNMDQEESSRLINNLFNDDLPEVDSPEFWPYRGSRLFRGYRASAAAAQQPINYYDNIASTTYGHSSNLLTGPILEPDMLLGHCLIDQLSEGSTSNLDESCEDLDEADGAYGRGIFFWSKGGPPMEAAEREHLKDIARQVEFYFSDGNICNDRFLQKHLKRNKAGYVSLKLVSSFKRVRNLTKEWVKVAQAIDQFSTMLEINDDMTKVRRLQDLPNYGASAPSRTLMATNLPLNRPTLQDVTNLFKQFGEIVSVRIMRPSNPVPADLRHIVDNHPDLAKIECATVEFARKECADAAVAQINGELRNKMKTTTLSKLAETSTGGDSNNLTPIQSAPRSVATSMAKMPATRWKNSKLFRRKVSLIEEQAASSPKAATLSI